MTIDTTSVASLGLGLAAFVGNVASLATVVAPFFVSAFSADVACLLALMAHLDGFVKGLVQFWWIHLNALLCGKEYMPYLWGSRAEHDRIPCS